MKKIDTLIRPSVWQGARAALEVLGVCATLREVQTFGRTPPHREVYRGSAYEVDLTRELELTALVDDELLESTVAALKGVSSSGEIFVSSVEGVVRFGSPSIAAVKPAATVPPRPNAMSMSLGVARA